MLREAAAQGNAEAYYQLYESSQILGSRRPRQGAAGHRAPRPTEALRKAAELGHPYSTQMLVTPARGRRPSSSAIPSPRDTGRSAPLANPAKDASKGSLAGDRWDACWRRRTNRTSAPAVSISSRRLAKAGCTFGARTRTGASRSARTIRCARARCSRKPAAPIPAAPSSAAGGNADRGRRRPGRPQARAVPAERRRPTAWMAKGMLGRLRSKANWCRATSRRRCA